MKKFLLSALSVLLLWSCGTTEPEKKPWEKETGGDDDAPAVTVGDPLPAWSEGYLDIHYISTNRGECAFYILPDGTTMVVDAGETYSSGTEIPKRPDNTFRTYEVYGKYIKHFLPASADGKIDYAFLTHFHIDHMGDIDSSNPIHPQGGYQLCGFPGLFEEVPFRKIIDRGYPSYDDDPSILPPSKESKSTGNFIKFVKYVAANKGVAVERFNVGTDKQLVLTGAGRDKYPDFRIFNHVGNGNCYQLDDGKNGYIKENEAGSENGNCCGFHLQYGKFDFIAAGDLVSVPQNQQALYVRDCVGKLEAFKSNHHMNTNSWGSTMQSTNFNPRVVIVPSFATKHADPGIMSYLAQQSWIKDIYLTKNWDSTMEAHKELYQGCAGYDGHVVIRVAPGGEKFNVYMLDNTDYQYKVKSVSRVYYCQ